MHCISKINNTTLLKKRIRAIKPIPSRPGAGLARPDLCAFQHPQPTVLVMGNWFPNLCIFISGMAQMRSSKDKDRPAGGNCF
jgi:hypothetical protein